MSQKYKIVLVVNPPPEAFAGEEDESLKLRALMQAFSSPKNGIFVADVAATTEEEFEFLHKALYDENGEIY